MSVNLCFYCFYICTVYTNTCVLVVQYPFTETFIKMRVNGHYCMLVYDVIQCGSLLSGYVTELSYKENFMTE
jgi:hypothetical protein